MNGKLFDKKISETAALIVAYLNGEISQEDNLRLSEWLSESEENRRLLENLQQSSNYQTDSDFFSSINVERSLEKIKTLTGQKPKPHFLQRYSKALKVACLIIFMTSAIGYYNILKKDNNVTAAIPLVQSVKAKTVIKAGGNRAQLELANGSTMVLENFTGSIIQENGARIERKEGIIYYTLSGTDSTDQIKYNRISTPKGGKYEIILPDGTHVWLNSESSLRFPISLSQKERVVELTGEAYFEVSKMPHKPFKVRVKDVTVEALGTIFNIMSYRNESSVKTTLIEGSIKVTKGQQSKLVTPGQQIEAKELLKVVDNSNVHKAIAWKADLFEFENDELKAIFPQLERWYDVEIAYSEEISIKRFTGSISRDTDVKVVLEMLKEAGIKYKIEERRIYLY